MKQMTPAAVERAMKLQDVMLRAMAKRITWFQAAEILGISCRQMQRWHTRFEHEGYEGLFDRRRGVPSPKWGFTRFDWSASQNRNHPAFPTFVN
jgi:transposase